MKIKINLQSSKSKACFDDLEIGDAFLARDFLFIKTSRIENPYASPKEPNAFCLNDSKPTIIEANVTVSIVEVSCNVRSFE